MVIEMARSKISGGLRDDLSTLHGLSVPKGSAILRYQSVTVSSAIMRAMRHGGKEAIRWWYEDLEHRWYQLGS
jgi:hypothetical protein